MLRSFTSPFISILLLCNLAALVIASPLVAGGNNGWRLIMLRRDLAQRRGPNLESQPTPHETWSIYITSTRYLQAEPQSDGQRWKGIGVKQADPSMSSQRALIIAQVKFATLAQQNNVLQELSTLKADSNVLYLVKVVTTIAKMAKADPAKERITEFEWKNKLKWEQKYWRMIETYADGVGGLVEGQEKDQYNILLSARSQKAMKGDNAGTQNST
ncbi:hypothetical protein F5050DRAFT_1715995 [Lentinula boryana]|uniref:Uncharacterized protein n=1 Tax=Lentinula boryana TaxID=40481 RepID=A0ABQ8PYP0_9AGAR|nr:hypothetical protein F5050DRAFT_1715995 [Lentinula boryana]